MGKISSYPQITSLSSGGFILVDTVPITSNSTSIITLAHLSNSIVLSGDVTGGLGSTEVTSTHLSSALPIAQGGTGAISVSAARGNLIAAESGANSDITSLSGLTTALSVTQGGTGASTLTGIVKGNGTSAFTAAISGTDYAPATSGSSILYGNGSGGFSNVTIGANLTFSGGTLTASGGSGTSGITRSVDSISTNTTAGSTAITDYVYLVSGTTTLTLPTAVSNSNLYTVKNVGAGTVTIATTSSQTIDGSSSAILSVKYTSLDLVSDGSNWNII